MAGYSGTPLWKKLGIKEDSRILADEAPKNFVELLAPLPKGAEIDKKPKGEYDVIVTFHKNIEDFEDRFISLISHLVDRGALWVSWPKGSSKMFSKGLNENAIRDIGLTTGLVDVKVCAIDEDWSGLKFVRRVK